MTLPITPNNSTTTSTKIIQGTNDVVNAEVSFFSRTKNIADTYMNYTRPPLAIGLEPIKKAFLSINKELSVIGIKSKHIPLTYSTPP